MTIHNNVSYASMPVGTEGHQTPSSINNRVEGVAFDVLFSQKPPSNTEQLRFKLIECGEACPSYCTTVTWKGKRYRITVHKTVHENEEVQAYSKADWEQVKDRTIKVLDEVQNNEHFFKGTLKLHAEAKDRWTVTYGNKTPGVKNPVSEKVIREFKNLFEKEIRSINSLPVSKSSKKLERASYPLNTTDKPAEKERTFFELPKKILEKIRNLRLFEQLKNRLFPSNNLDDFDLSSSEASVSSFEKINHEKFEDVYNNRTNSLNDSLSKETNIPEEDDDLDDNTSLGGITVASSRISNDSGLSYIL